MRAEPTCGSRRPGRSLSKIDHEVLPEAVYGQAMTSAAAILTHEEFASLVTVGNARANTSAPVIPAAHSAHLIALGYMVDLEGRLQMTTPGRMRIYARQIAS